MSKNRFADEGDEPLGIVNSDEGDEDVPNENKEANTQAAMPQHEDRANDDVNHRPTLTMGGITRVPKISAAKLPSKLAVESQTYDDMPPLLEDNEPLARVPATPVPASIASAVASSRSQLNLSDDDVPELVYDNSDDMDDTFDSDNPPGRNAPAPTEKVRASRVPDPKSEERRKRQMQAFLARRREEDERRKREQEEGRRKRMEDAAKQREQQRWNLENDPDNVFGAEPEQPEQAEGDDDPVPILTCRHCQKRIFLVKIIEPRIEAVCDSKPPCTLVYHKHCWVDVQKSLPRDDERKLLKCPTDGCGGCITKYQVVSRYGKKQRVDREVNLETGEEQDAPVVQVPQKKEKKRHTFKSGTAGDDDDEEDPELSALLAESERLKKEKEERQKQQAIERQQQQEAEQKQRELEREQKRKQKEHRANQQAAGVSIVAQRAVPVRTEPRQVEVATAPTEDDAIRAMKAMEASGRWVIRDDDESDDEEEPAQLTRQQKKNMRKREKAKKQRTITIAGGIADDETAQWLSSNPPDEVIGALAQGAAQHAVARQEQPAPSWLPPKSMLPDLPPVEPPNPVPIDPMKAVPIPADIASLAPVLAASDEPQNLMPDSTTFKQTK